MNSGVDVHKISTQSPISKRTFCKAFTVDDAAQRRPAKRSNVTTNNAELKSYVRKAAHTTSLPQSRRCQDVHKDRKIIIQMMQNFEDTSSCMYVCCLYPKCKRYGDEKNLKNTEDAPDTCSMAHVMLKCRQCNLLLWERFCSPDEFVSKLCDCCASTIMTQEHLTMMW